MFGTIRKHQSWLWIVIIVAMILGLVVYFSPTAGKGNSGSGNANFGSIDGVKITQNDFVNASREAALGYLLNYGTWPDSGAQRANFDAQRETYQRLFFLQKLKQYNVHVDDEAVAQMANSILLQFGRGRPVPLDVFVQQVLRGRATAEDFERYVRHQLELQQLISVIGISGDLVTAKEAESIYVRENQELATEAVFFSGSNYLTSVTTPTPEVLKEFYTNQMSAYRLPERIQVSYVSFDATNFLAQAERERTNLTEEVQMSLTQLGTNYTEIAKTPEEAKLKIREILLERQALGHANDKAREFATVLFDMNPPSAENLARLARTNGLQVHVTAPFDAQTGPTEFDGGPNFTRDAFRLTEEQPFADPVAGTNAVYVIALQKRIPSEVPSFESIHDQVANDYKRVQSSANARRAGAAFIQTITNGLAQGKTFSAIVSGAGLKTQEVPPISLSTRELPQIEDRVSLNQFKQVVFGTQPGKVSEFVPTADGGFLVYVDRRLPIDQAKMTKDMPDFLKAVRQTRRQEAINLWLQREGTKSLQDTPLMQQKPSTIGGQGKS